MNISSITTLNFNRSKLGTLTSLLACFMVWGCSGDPRPLQEAVEASNLNLGRLVIDSGRDSERDIVLNAGEFLQFTFSAFDAANQEIPVANSNRLWSSSNYDVVDISDSGGLIAVADGTVNIGLRIGGIIAQPVTVVVSTRDLTSISAIEGQQTLTECSSSMPYTALGTFGSGGEQTIRPLSNVEWSVAQNDVGRILSQDGSEAVVGVVRPGAVTLVASVGDISGSREIMVVGGLEVLSIIPEEVEVERSANLSLRANATYGGNPTAQVVTRLVNWSVQEEDIIASVSNDAGSEGVLRGLQTGTTVVNAACGENITMATVTVVEPANIVRLEIEPDDDPITINASGAEFQLRAFAISSLGSREEITQNASWQVESGEEFVTVDNSSSSGGLLDPIAPGTATISVSYINLTERVTVLVQ